MKRLIHDFKRQGEILAWAKQLPTLGPMGKKSHVPLFILFDYFTHLVPPTGLFWTIFLPCHFSQKMPLPVAITVWSKQKWKPRSPINYRASSKENFQHKIALRWFWVLWLVEKIWAANQNAEKNYARVDITLTHPLYSFGEWDQGPGI